MYIVKCTYCTCSTSTVHKAEKSFKGGVSQDFRPPVFSKLKYFRIWFRFRRDIRSQSCHRGVQQTKEIKKILSKSKNFSSNLFFYDRCVYPLKNFPDCLFKSNHRQVKVSTLIVRCAIYLRGMLCTAEIISTVHMLHTAEMISVVCCTPRRSSWRSGVLHTAETTLGSNISTKLKQNPKML